MAKEKMAVYFQPETIKKIEQEYQEDNCTSKTEFIEKAVKFYIGYLWFCQYHLTHFIRTRIMQRERYDHSRAFFGLPEAVRRWRCRFFC